MYHCFWDLIERSISVWPFVLPPLDPMQTYRSSDNLSPGCGGGINPPSSIALRLYLLQEPLHRARPKRMVVRQILELDIAGLLGELISILEAIGRDSMER